MSKKLFDFLDFEVDDKIYEDDIELYFSKEEDRLRIDKLFYLGLSKDNKFDMYFYGVPVPEPYDGYEFGSEEEEFYYNNSRSYIVFRDKFNCKVKFKLKTLKYYDFDLVTEVVKKAIEYTKEHPEVAKYKVY